MKYLSGFSAAAPTSNWSTGNASSYAARTQSKAAPWSIRVLRGPSWAFPCRPSSAATACAQSAAPFWNWTMPDYSARPRLARMTAFATLTGSVDRVARGVRSWAMTASVGTGERANLRIIGAKASKRACPSKQACARRIGGGPRRRGVSAPKARFTFEKRISAFPGSQKKAAPATIIGAQASKGA